MTTSAEISFKHQRIERGNIPGINPSGKCCRESGKVQSFLACMEGFERRNSFPIPDVSRAGTPCGLAESSRRGGLCIGCAARKFSYLHWLPMVAWRREEDSGSGIMMISKPELTSSLLLLFIDSACSLEGTYWRCYRKSQCTFWKVAQKYEHFYGKISLGTNNLICASNWVSKCISSEREI